MTLARIRVAFCSVLAALLAAAWTTAAGQGTPPGRETSAESVAPTRSRSRCRSIPKSPSARCRTACAITCAPNAKPARRAELRLVVKAGSVLEDDDQQGLAHFVEHMVFEGTRNFPRQGISEFLATLGARHRSGCERADELRRHAVHCCACRPTCRACSIARCSCSRTGRRPRRSIRARIERERGIVLSEWRMHLGAGERTTDKMRQVQLEGSRYADRSPIGKPEHHRARAARAAAALLSRLVSPESDGRHRRRRRRPRRGRRR